ncbi:FAD-dependent oxidoreductase [Streptomyces sp. NPDC013953]|uniref:FAD-dependent oxidoreductase n=1 Tax=Streptomyces sp. NPDC013953 TaxID=3364868 RepID=UPI00370237BD
MSRRLRAVDVLVVGAGPAGLAAARRLAAAGAGTVEVLERQRHALGARGPARAAVRAGAVLRAGVTATGWAGPLTLDTTGPDGLERITARAVVLATGARERPRSARLVPGTRPAGVLTAGELRQAVYGYGQYVGTRALVVGAEPVAFGAVRALRRAGVRVVALVTEDPWRRPGAFGPGRTPVPVLGGTAVAELLGRGRLSGVRLVGRDGRTTTVACDTVVFTGDWIPEHELARLGGAELDRGTRGPAVDSAFRTSQAGVFAVGGVLHGGEPAATVVAQGRAVAGPVREFLAGVPPWPAPRVPVVADAPLRWVAPNRLVPGEHTGRFLVRARRRLERPVLSVAQDGVLLHRQRVRGTATPSRSVSLAGGWAAAVDPGGGPVRITVAGPPTGRRDGGPRSACRG